MVPKGQVPNGGIRISREVQHQARILVRDRSLVLISINGRGVSLVLSNFSWLFPSFLSWVKGEERRGSGRSCESCAAACFTGVGDDAFSGCSGASATAPLRVARRWRSRRYSPASIESAQPSTAARRSRLLLVARTLCSSLALSARRSRSLLVVRARGAAHRLHERRPWRLCRLLVARARRPQEHRPLRLQCLMCTSDPPSEQLSGRTR